MRTTIAIAMLAAALFAAGRAHAEVKTKEVEYKVGDQPLQGFLAWDDAAKGKRPGVLIVHEWWGHNQHARNQAIRAAKAGYVAFALDMYGKGKVADPTHPKDAMAFMEAATKDPAVAQARFTAGVDELKKAPGVDPDKIAAFGYCFGGGVALHMARAGVPDLKAVVTFHGSLAPVGPPAEKGKVKAQILVNTGAKDPMVNKAQVDAFEKEMKDAGAKVEIKTYANAKHGFTNPDAGKAGMDGLAYDAEADQQSWDAAMKFLKQVFGS